VTGLAHASSVLQLVPGSPEVVENLARHLGTYGYGAADAAVRLQRIGTSDWVGQAAQAFRDQVGEVPAKLTRGARSFQEAAEALHAHGAVLRSSQRQAGVALSVWDTAEAASRTWGSIDPQVGPDPGVDGRSLAEQLLAAALEDVRRSGSRLAATMDRASEGAPRQPGLLHRAWHAISSFARGAAEATWGLAEFSFHLSPTYLVMDPLGYLHEVEALGKGLYYGARHPKEFGKAVLDWDTWQDDPARAIGHLVPDLLLAVATGGAGGAARGAEALSRLERIGVAVDRAGNKLFTRLPQSVVDQRLVDLGYDLSTPAGKAAQFQIQAPYGGIDPWVNRPLVDGELVAFGAPGIGGFGVVLSKGVSEVDAVTYFEGLQVGPRRSGVSAPMQRPKLEIYTVRGQVDAARSLATHNPHFGAGGSPQVFVPGFNGGTFPGLSLVETRLFAPGTLRSMIEDPRFRAVDPKLPSKPMTVEGQTTVGRVEGSVGGLVATTVTQAAGDCSR
jgi:hypothetical protein